MKKDGHFDSKIMHSCMHQKESADGNGELKKQATHSCVQNKGVNKGRLSDNSTSKFLSTQIALGVIGVIGIWYLSPSFEAFVLGEILNSLIILSFIICVLFLIAGVWGIYDWIRKTLILKR